MNEAQGWCFRMRFAFQTGDPAAKDPRQHHWSGALQQEG